MQRSFVSHPKSKYLCREKHDNVDLLTLPKGGSDYYWFICNECNHYINLRLSTVSNGGWCKYCSPAWEHCGNPRCRFCYNRSFASHPKCEEWNYSKNIETPENPIEYAIGSTAEKWFTCKECNNVFKTTLMSVYNNHFCPVCKNKTEKMMLLYLKTLNIFSLVKEAKFDWSMGSLGIHYRYDFYFCDSTLKELDGKQHFIQVRTWESPEHYQNRDIVKMKLAFQNGKNVIRIYQQDVYDNTGNWKGKLEKAINIAITAKSPVYLYVKTNNKLVTEIYEKYGTACQQYISNVDAYCVDV